MEKLSLFPDTVRIDSFGVLEKLLKYVGVDEKTRCNLVGLGLGNILSKSDPKTTATSGYFRQKYLPWADWADF